MQQSATGIAKKAGPKRSQLLQRLKRNERQKLQKHAEMQESTLRDHLKKNTTMTPEQIDKVIDDALLSAQSHIQAALDKYGNSNLPHEMIREVMDLVKEWTKTMVQIADWSSVLRASASR